MRGSMKNYPENTFERISYYGESDSGKRSQLRCKNLDSAKRTASRQHFKRLVVLEEVVQLKLNRFRTIGKNETVFVKNKKWECECNTKRCGGGIRLLISFLNNGLVKK